MAGSDYETVARERCGGLADNQRALFFEGGWGLLDRVSTFSICRNGTAYLVGCMAQGCPEAHIVKACLGDMVVEEAASAFASGYMKYSAGGSLEVHPSLFHISQPTRQAENSYARFCFEKKKKK